MPTTYISTGDPKAVKIFSVMLLAENIRASRMLNMLSAGASKIGRKMAEAKRARAQTEPGTPIVTAADLTKRAGDRITVDFIKTLNGKPIMGSKMAEGRGVNLNFDTQEFKINQTRFPVQAGDTMSQKRTEHDLRSLAKASLKEYYGRLYDQRITIMLAGARGTENKADWIVPHETDPDFAEIMVNTVTPPTTNRYFVAGGGNDVTDITDADALKLEDLDTIKTYLREEAFPLGPVEVHKSMDGDDPLWCMFVTQRQWHYMLARAGADNIAWRNFIAAATTRRAITKHPLFMGTCGIWNGFLIKQIDRPIRFDQGANVKTINSDTQVQQTHVVKANITVDRALIVGSQALAHVLGNAEAMGSKFNNRFPIYWSEKMLDHDDKLEISGKVMDGFGKFRFLQKDNKLTDHGVAVIDSYAPDPRSEAGINLRNALQV